MNFICRYMSIVNIGGDMNTNEEKDIENVLKHVFENINSDEKSKAKIIYQMKIMHYYLIKFLKMGISI